MGGGTGSNLEFFGNNLNHWGKCVVLDLCPSLAETARKRVQNRGWESFVSVVVGLSLPLSFTFSLLLLLSLSLSLR